MASLGNAPYPSLEVQVHRALCMRPSGMRTDAVLRKFRRWPQADVMATLECLRSAQIIACTDGRWWTR